ncbi:terminase small subunit [Mediterraneibacter faecis]|uniref:terminase small subunit n=1 Tax=Mediterraneibacter faecis TaxID=592978 RepID=UPI003F9A4F67
MSISFLYYIKYKSKEKTCHHVISRHKLLQKTTVEEYLIDLNATQSAIRAGYSPKTANEQGARLLANVSIQEA